VRFDENKSTLRFLITVLDTEGEVVETIPKQLMGSTCADGYSHSPRISLTSKHIPDCIKKTRTSGYKLFERAPFPFLDKELLTVKQVAGTNYGNYYNSYGKAVDASEVVWHFLYEGDADQIAALKRIHVELLAEEGAAAAEPEEGGMEEQ